MQSYVFISYSSQNIEMADKLRKILNNHGFGNWMAPYDIPAGAKYAHTIDEAICHCACVLLLLTQNAQDSGHVEREIERAISYKKEIIPIRLDNCELNAGFRYYIGSCQITDMKSLDENAHPMQAILNRLEQVLHPETDAFRAFERTVQKWVDSPKKYVIHQERLELLECLYNSLIELLKEEGYDKETYTISIEPDALGFGDAAITLIADDIVIHNMEKFCDIIWQFSNFEIYPRVDDKLCFSGLFKKVAQVVPQQTSGRCSGIKALWNNGTEEEWKKAIDGYYALLGKEQLVLEKEIERTDASEIGKLDALGFFHFLFHKYFVWKYTARNRLATTRKNLVKYLENNDLVRLENIQKRLFSMPKEDIGLCLKTAGEIRGLGTAGASGLLAILFPKEFGTVDQFVVKKLQEIEIPDHQDALLRMNPESLKIDDGVLLIGIMREKAAELNRKFQTDFWTPRKIDMVLWSFGRGM